MELYQPYLIPDLKEDIRNLKAEIVQLKAELWKQDAPITDKDINFQYSTQDELDSHLHKLGTRIKYLEANNVLLRNGMKALADMNKLLAKTGSPDCTDPDCDGTDCKC